MLRAKIGCCCGCIIGFCSLFVLLFALAFGIYCWICPEVWERTVNKIEGIWSNVKNEGDRLVDSVPRPEGQPAPAANASEDNEAPAFPEPEVKRE